jgi:hypothetical protein
MSDNETGRVVFSILNKYRAMTISKMTEQSEWKMPS